MRVFSVPAARTRLTCLGILVGGREVKRMCRRKRRE